jgi:sucrose-6-phosphate hydrolase SacC (GH32 family)
MNNSNNLNENVFKSKRLYESGYIELLLDTSSIEVFIDDGKETITSRFFISGDSFKTTYKGINSINSKALFKK